MFPTVLSAVFSWLGVFSITSHTSTTTMWFDNYSHSVAEVRRVDKPLFIVLDRGSSPAGKMVTDGPYLSAEVEEALAADYVRLFIDTETDAGRKLAAQFDAAELPRVVIIDRSGEWQVYRRSGVHTASDLLSLLVRHRRAKIASHSDGATSETRSTTSTTTWSPALCKT